MVRFFTVILAIEYTSPTSQLCVLFFIFFLKIFKRVKIIYIFQIVTRGKGERIQYQR